KRPSDRVIGPAGYPPRGLSDEPAGEFGQERRMRVVIRPLRGEVRAERRRLTVAHPGVVVGFNTSVQFPDRWDSRCDGRVVREVGAWGHGAGPYRRSSRLGHNGNNLSIPVNPARISKGSRFAVSAP